MKSNPLHTSLAYYNMSPGSRHSSCRYVYYPHFEEHKSDTVSQRSDREERKQGSETVLFSKIRQQCSKYESNQVCTNLTSSQNRPIKCSITNITDEKPLRPTRLDWNDYHRLDVIHSFMDDLEYDYPSLCTTGVIGKSREGRDLKILKVSNSNASNTSVWIDAGIHAREWIAPATATFVANKIVKNFNDLPENITNKDWYFLPVMNPDGYEFSHTNDRMWRKNRAWYGGRCVGVDLNRNFSHGWGCKGSSSSPIHAFYHGPEPFSEPESSAVRDMLTHSDVQFTVYITLHSYGQIILFPFAFQEELCPSYVRLLEGATVMSRVAPPPKHYTQVWEVQLSKEGQRYFVRSLDTVGAINIWKEERSKMDIMVEGPQVAQITSLLQEREIPYSVAVNDVNRLIEREQGLSTLKSFRTRNMDWKSYHKLDVIYAFLDKLAEEYPYLCSVSVIGQSVESRAMKMLKISNGQSGNIGVWLDGAIHPREWISSAVVTYLADKLVKTFHMQPESVTNKDWYILPVLNPDGYVYTHTQDRMWRKNRARYGECVGVDLNRNFSHGWGEKGEEGSSEDPGNIFFRGSEPFSEPETTAVKEAIENADTKFMVYLSFHSYGEVIIFPWGYTGDPCPDYVELLEAGTAMAKAIYDTNGHTYRVGSTKDLMYFASGTSSDWAYAVADIPYSYMVELRGKKHRFLLPPEEIVTTSKEVWNGVMRLMDFVDKKSHSPKSISPK